jgi:hypothetical protein
VTDRPSPRALGTACAGLALSAVLLWAGSATVWYRVLRPGAAPVELTGASVAPWLGGTALLALAGVAGVVATGGVLRRLVGALLGLAGAGVLVLGVQALLTDPNATDATGAPLLAVAGALVLLAVGIAVLVRGAAAAPARRTVCGAGGATGGTRPGSGRVGGARRGSRPHGRPRRGAAWRRGGRSWRRAPKCACLA